MSIYGWNNDFNQLERSVNRLFDNFMSDLSSARRSERNQNEVARRYWSPLIDVHESDKEFVVKADLPVCIYRNFLILSIELYTKKFLCREFPKNKLMLMFTTILL